MAAQDGKFLLDLMSIPQGERFAGFRSTIPARCDDYEQITAKEIADQRRIAGRDGLLAERKMRSVPAARVDLTVPLPLYAMDDNEYVVLPPMSGMLSRDRELTTLSLPSIAEASRPINRPVHSRSTNNPLFARPVLRRDVVYDRESEFIRSISDAPASAPLYIAGLPTLTFDSNFECGNLRRAEKLMRRSGDAASAYEEYDLFIDEDPKASPRQHAGPLQWFYFQVKHVQKKIKYRFNIHSFSKKR